MGRHARLPDHLYLTPPPEPQKPFSLRGYTSPIDLLSEPYESALAVGDRIPGFKTSAAFLNSLRANLRLADDSFLHPSPGSNSPSLTNTPDSLRPSMASSTASLENPQSSPLANPPDTLEEITRPEDPLADIPPLTTSQATTDEDKIEALRLIADSVAQQRQLASRAIIFHPITLSVYVALMAAVGQIFYKGDTYSLILAGMTYIGIVMTGLVSVRWATSAYIERAEQVGTWKWLDDNRSGNEVVLLTRYGEEIIGTVVVRGEKEVAKEESGGAGSGVSRKDSKKHKKSASQGNGKAQIKGLIRAWTVKRRYRKREIGEGLLEDAVELCNEKGWAGPVFADDHANSLHVLPYSFDGGFVKREEKARKMLESVIEEKAKLQPFKKKGKR